MGLGLFFFVLGPGQWLVVQFVNSFNLPYVQAIGASFYYPLLMFAVLLFIPEMVFQFIMFVCFEIVRIGIIIFDACTYNKFKDCAKNYRYFIANYKDHKNLYVYTNIVRTIKIACLVLFFRLSIPEHYELLYNITGEKYALFVGMATFLAAISLADSIKDFHKSVSEKLNDQKTKVLTTGWLLFVVVLVWLSVRFVI